MQMLRMVVGVWVRGRGTGMNWEVGMDMNTLSCVLTCIHYDVYEHVYTTIWHVYTTMCMNMYILPCVWTCTHYDVYGHVHTTVCMDVYTLVCVWTCTHYRVYGRVYTTMCIDMYTLPWYWHAHAMMCKRDSQWEPAAQHRELSLVLCGDL